MALLMELGLGAFFYYGVLFLSVFYIGHKMLLYAQRKVDSEALSLIKVCFISIIVIIIGNWGREGIPYNPESFFFWFWVSQAFYQVRRTQEKARGELKIVKGSLVD